MEAAEASQLLPWASLAAIALATLTFIHRVYEKSKDRSSGIPSTQQQISELTSAVIALTNEIRHFREEQQDNFREVRQIIRLVK